MDNFENNKVSHKNDDIKQDNVPGGKVSSQKNIKNRVDNSDKKNISGENKSSKKNINTPKKIIGGNSSSENINSLENESNKISNEDISNSSSENKKTEKEENIIIEITNKNEEEEEEFFERPDKDRQLYLDKKSPAKSKTIKIGKRYLKREGSVIFKGTKAHQIMNYIQTSLDIVLEPKTHSKEPIRTKIKAKDKKQKIAKNFGVEDLKSHGLDPTIYRPFFFREYQPLLFQNIRNCFKLTEKGYWNALCKSVLKLIGSPGKSGSLFWITENKKFLIKTIKKSETKFLFKLLPKYLNYIKDQENTLLVRFYGLYRIQPKGKNNIRFIVMNNFFFTNKKIHKKYDLKGSLVGRTATEEDLEKNEECIFKDNDLNNYVRLKESTTWRFLKQIHTDTKFLTKVNIMDYSLLLGIHNPIDDFKIPEKKRVKVEDLKKVISDKEDDLKAFSLEERNIFQLDCGGTSSKIFLGKNGKPSYYFFGIIDILQPYNTKKKLEYLVKGFAYNRSTISCNPPKEYRRRFLAYMRGIFVDPYSNKPFKKIDLSK